MNLMFLLSPLILSFATLAVVFVCILYILDARRVSHQKHLRKLMRSFVNENAAQPFSVIVRADSTAASVVPLLDSLERQNYAKLQVIIIVGSASSNKLTSDLRRIQRQKKGSIQLRIVSQGTKTDQSLIRRYADGEALLWLGTDDRLSKDFFTRMSIELLDESCQALSPRIAIRTDDTLRTASRALNLVAKQSITTLLGRRSATPRVVRRSAYLQGTISQPTSIEHSTVTVKELPNERANVLIETGILAAILVVTVTAAILLPYGWQFIAYAFVGVIILLMVLRLLTYPYSAWTKLALGLMIPLWPPTVLILSTGSIVRRAVGRVLRLRADPAR
jgi:hypothetical protein